MAWGGPYSVEIEGLCSSLRHTSIMSFSMRGGGARHTYWSLARMEQVAPTQDGIQKGRFADVCTP